MKRLCALLIAGAVCLSLAACTADEGGVGNSDGDNANNNVNFAGDNDNGEDVHNDENIEDEEQEDELNNDYERRAFCTRDLGVIKNLTNTIAEYIGDRFTAGDNFEEAVNKLADSISTGKIDASMVEGIVITRSERYGIRLVVASLYHYYDMFNGEGTSQTPWTSYDEWDSDGSDDCIFVKGNSDDLDVDCSNENCPVRETARRRNTAT